MEARELRLGNYFHPTRRERHVRIKFFAVYKVVSIGAEVGGIYMMDNHTEVRTVPSFKPIEMMEVELTDEIMARFGFFPYNNGSHNIVSVYDGRIRLNRYKNGTEDQGYWMALYQGPSTVRIKYAHDLQNLYFALTGDELTFKL